MFRVVSIEDIRPVALALRRASHVYTPYVHAVRYCVTLQDCNCTHYNVALCGAVTVVRVAPSAATLVILSVTVITLGQRPVGSGPLTGVLIVSPIFSVGLLLKRVTLWGCCSRMETTPERQPSLAHLLRAAAKG